MHNMMGRTKHRQRHICYDTRTEKLRVQGFSIVMLWPAHCTASKQDLTINLIRHKVLALAKKILMHFKFFLVTFLSGRTKKRSLKKLDHIISWVEASTNDEGILHFTRHSVGETWQMCLLVVFQLKMFPFIVTGRDQLCHTEGSQIQPGNAHLPPMEGQQTSLRSQFF